jgi:helix-turn-helix, Psq domain
MKVYTQEAQIILAIDAICTAKKLSIRKAAKIYNIPYLTLFYRMASQTSVYNYRPVVTKLSELEEEVIVRYILDLDNKGFRP